MLLHRISYLSENVTFYMNGTIPPSVQAYLDSFPFGNFTPLGSELLVPVLVLSAESNFIYATAALYVVFSGTLFLVQETISQTVYNPENVECNWHGHCPLLPYISCADKLQQPRSTILQPLNMTSMTQQQKLTTKPSVTSWLCFMRIWSLDIPFLKSIASNNQSL